MRTAKCWCRHWSFYRSFRWRRSHFPRLGFSLRCCMSFLVKTAYRLFQNYTFCPKIHLDQKVKKSLIRVTYFLQIRLGWILQISKIQSSFFVKIYFLDENWIFTIVCSTELQNFVMHFCFPAPPLRIVFSLSQWPSELWIANVIPKEKRRVFLHLQTLALSF